MIYSIERIVKQLRDKRKSSGLSQRELGKKIKIPQSHLSKIERAEVDLQASTLLELARFLDFELVLIPREYLLMVRAIITGTTSRPAYELQEGDEDE